jgi:hypothetical protein
MVYDQAIFDAICDRIADGESLRSVCRDKAMPSKANFFRWVAANKEAADQYARAMEVRSDVLFDELLDIADDGTNDWMDRANADGQTGDKVLNAEHVQRSRLRIDARKWALAKMQPKKYGDKLDLNHGGGMVVTIAGPDADL